TVIQRISVETSYMASLLKIIKKQVGLGQSHIEMISKIKVLIGCDFFQTRRIKTTIKKHIKEKFL
ncbi:MAG TPA: hypothetical protein PK860_00325, partial [Paludibacteraceae bacterium]|nr:hypothetical protein [Paludibacteraceae bacterium]